MIKDLFKIGIFSIDLDLDVEAISNYCIEYRKNDKAPNTPGTLSNSGGYHSCALLDNNNAQCWGQNDVEQLGDGTTTKRLTPVTVSGISNATTIDVDTGNSCALLSNQNLIYVFLVLKTCNRLHLLSYSPCIVATIFLDAPLSRCSHK